MLARDTLKAAAFDPSSGTSRLFRGQRLMPVVLFLPPALLLFTLFVVLPMGEAAYYSFFRWDGFGAPTEVVGLRNFEFLTRNRAFQTALINNGLIILISLVVQLPLALMLAIMLADRFKGAITFRLIFFMPYVLAEVAAGLIWRFVYDGEYGLIEGAFSMVGADAPFLLADKDTAMYAILGVIVWKYFGFHMMLFIAGLQNIDRNLYEAARIDGASRLQLLRYVTIPMLSPMIKLSIFFAILGSMQLFDLIMPLTKGGPSDSTQTMVSYLYNFGIVRMRIGFGSAVGVVLFVVCVCFAFGYQRTVMRND